MTDHRTLAQPSSGEENSVSHGVIQHADRPVILVPSQEVAAARGERQHRG